MSMEIEPQRNFLFPKFPKELNEMVIQECKFSINFDFIYFGDNLGE